MTEEEYYCMKKQYYDIEADIEIKWNKLVGYVADVGKWKKLYDYLHEPSIAEGLKSNRQKAERFLCEYNDAVYEARKSIQKMEENGFCVACNCRQFLRDGASRLIDIIKDL